MTALTSVANLVTLLSGAQDNYIIRQPPVGNISWYSGWKDNVGGYPTVGANPAAPPGTTYDRTSVGAIPMTNASASHTLRLLQMFCIGNAKPSAIMLYDRLWSTTLAGTSSPETVNSATLPARITDNGVGCEIWWENYVTNSPGWTAVTATYTNPDGTGSHTASNYITIPTGSGGRYSMGPLQLQDGDTGVKTIESVSWTGTAGATVGLTILKPIATVVLNNPYKNSDYGDMGLWGLPTIPNDACLALAVYSHGNIGNQNNPGINVKLLIAEADT